jgi:hypothetical protein
MSQPESVPMMVVSGDPGTGKSSLLRQFAERVPTDHLLARVSRAPDEVDPFDGMSLLSAVIDKLTNLGFDAVEPVRLPPSSGVNVIQQVDEIQAGGIAFANVMKLTTAGGLLPVAERLVRSVPEDRHPLIVIDALDQAEDEDAVEFLDLTAALVRAAQRSGVRLLCASRRKLPLAFDENLAVSFDLSLDAPEGEDDLRRYLDTRFEDLQTDDRERVVGAIFNGSDGNWLWASTNADSLEAEIEKHGSVPKKMHMTQGLEGLYGDGVRRMRQRLQEDWTSFGRQLLTVVACSLDEHLTITELRFTIGEMPSRIEDATRACEPFLRRTENGVRLFHPDFGRWILADNVEGVSEEEGHLAVARGFTELGKATHWSSEAANAATRVIEHWCALLVLDPFSPTLREHEEEIGKVLMDPAWVAQARLGLDAIEQAALMAPTLRFPSTNLPLATGLRVLHDSPAAHLLVGREIAAEFPPEKLEELNSLADTPALGVRWLEKELKGFENITMRTLWGRVVSDHVTIQRSNGELRAFVSAEGLLSSMEELDAKTVSWLIDLSPELDDEQLDLLLEGVEEEIEKAEREPQRRALLFRLLGGSYHERAQRGRKGDDKRSEDLQRALASHRRSLSETPSDSPVWRSYVIEVANAIRNLDHPTESDLEQLVEVQGRLVELRREAGESTWRASSNLLGDAYRDRSQMRADADEARADLELAIVAYRKAVDATEENDPQLVPFMFDLADALFTLENRAAPEVDELIDLQQRLLELRRTMGDPLWPQALNLLGDCYRERALLKGEEGEEDMARSLAAFREGLAAVPPGSQLRLPFAVDFANALFELDERSPIQIEELIAAQGEVVELRRQADEEEWPVSARLLGAALRLRADARDSDVAGRDSDLRKALSVCEEGLAALPPESGKRIEFAIDIGNILRLLSECSEAEADRLVEVQREVLDARRSGDEDWVPSAYLAGRAYYQRSKARSDAESAEEDLHSAREALVEALGADPEPEVKIACLAELSNTFGNPSDRSDEELQQSIAVQSELVELRQARDEDKWTLSSNMLGDSYLETSRRQEDPETKEQTVRKALHAYREALEAVPLTHENRQMFLIDYINALRQLEQRTSDELGELIAAQEELLARFWQVSSPKWPQIANLLGDAYRERAVDAEGKPDPESEHYRKAIVAYREALSGAPAGSKERLVYATDLANSLLELPKRSKIELEELITVQSELVGLRRDAEEEDWPVSSHFLGDAYRERAQRKEDQGELWEEDLRQALDAYRTALDAVSPDSPHRLTFVIGLANALRDLKSRRTVGEVDELVAVQAELVEIRRRTDEPNWPYSSNLLGDAYAERARQRDDDEARAEDLKSALAAYKDAYEAMSSDDDRPLLYVVDLANTMVLLAIATREGGSQTLEEATALVAEEVDSGVDDPEFMRLLPVLRAAFRRRGRWTV